MITMAMISKVVRNRTSTTLSKSMSRILEKSFSTNSAGSNATPTNMYELFLPIVGTTGIVIGVTTVVSEYVRSQQRQTGEVSEAQETTVKKKRKEKTAVVEPKSEQDVVFNLHNKQRTVFVTGTIDDKQAHRVVAQLVHLNYLNAKEPIVMVINSGGGVVTSGYAILDTMRAIEAPVVTYAVGHAESMAAILLASGERGRRFCAPNARIMIHQPHHSMSGMTSDILIKATKAEETRTALTGTLVETTGKSFEEVEKALDRNTYLFGESAKAFGLIDDVVVNWNELNSKIVTSASGGSSSKSSSSSSSSKSSDTSTAEKKIKSERVNGGRGLIGEAKEDIKKQETVVVAI